MMLKALSPDTVASVMAVAADTLAQDLFAPRSGTAASLALRAHTVEALLVLHPTLPAVEALRLAGLAGGGGLGPGPAKQAGEASAGEVDALRVAHCMSGPSWDSRLLRVLCGVLRLLAPPAPGARVTVRSGQGDATARSCGDPPPGRSALDRRARTSLDEARP